MPEVILKKGWARVAFGDVAKLSGQRSSNPEEDGFKRFVGLEHIDPGDLKIRRWGDIVDGTTFTSVFRPGQVLFGKRRAYQRKVAVATFSGVCSGDIYVLEPANALLLPDLLPFICQTDGFFEHAVGTSAGSLSPRTNWDSLASYEFALPPLDEQRQIAAALSAVQVVEDQLFALMESCDLLFASCLEKRMCVPNTKTVALRDIATVERGKFTHRPRNLPEFYGGAAEFVQTGDVASSRGILGPASQTLSELGKTYSRSFPPGTVLVTIAAVIGATAVATREVWFPDSIVGVCPDERLVESTYAELALRRLRPVLEMHEATASTQKNINLAVLRPLRIPLFPLDVQKHIVEELGQVERARAEVQTRRAALYGLRQSMLAGTGRGQ